MKLPRIHFSLGILFWFVLMSPAHAHELGAEIKIIDKRVVVEAYYDDGTDARNADVKILDGDSKVVAEGKTDSKGKWSFPVPKPGKYLADVNAGAGHRVKVHFTVPKTATAKPASPPEPAAAKPSSPGSEPATVPDKPEVISSGPSRGEFTQTPWLKLGIGVGVIGLMGLAMLAAVRRQKKNGPPGNGH